MRRQCLLLLLPLALASWWGLGRPGRAYAGHKDRDRVRLLSAVDAPDPFAPPSSSDLSVSAAVRKVTGLGTSDADDDDECDDDKSKRAHGKTFQLRVTWSISGASLIRRIEKTVTLQAPFTYAQLPVNGKKQRKFAVVPVVLSWDGRDSGGNSVPPASYSYEVLAEFLRVHQHKNNTTVTLLDESDTASGTVTVQSGTPAPPTVLAVPSLTNLPVIALSGTKPANSALLVDGVVRVPQDSSVTWSTTQTLIEGPNAITLTTRNAAGLDSSAVTVSITLDTVPPIAPTVNTVPPAVNTPSVTISGSKPAGTAIYLNGLQLVPLDGSTTWSANVTLTPGRNDLVIEAVDSAGNRSLTEGGRVAAVALNKPVIGDLQVSPPVAPTGTAVSLAYKLFARVPPAENAELRTTVTIEDGDNLVRTVFAGIQTGSPSGTPYTLSWDGRDDQGQLVAVNTSYRVVVSAEHSSATTLPASLVDANPKESAVTVTGSQQVSSPDGKLRVVFRPDDARLNIAASSTLSFRQASRLTGRRVQRTAGPYSITVDRAFTSPVVAMYSNGSAIGRHLRPFQWDPVQQDWQPIARTTWNPNTNTLAFALSGAGTYLLGAAPDSEPPALLSCTGTGPTTLRILDRGTGIDPSKTRVRCRGQDRTGSLSIVASNGVHAQTLTLPAEPDTVIYLEDRAGNGRLYRVRGGVR